MSVRVCATQLADAAQHGRLHQRSPLLRDLLQKAAGQPSEAEQVPAAASQCNKVQVIVRVRVRASWQAYV